MTERHGDRPDTPADRPAPTLTSKARTDLLLRVAPTATMRERERDVGRPAPTLAFGHNANGWEWVVNTRQKSLKGGQRTEDYKRSAERPSPTLTGQAGGFWQWERPATTGCGDPRIPAPGYRKGTERAFDGVVTSDEFLTGDVPGPVGIKLTVEEALTLQGFSPDYPVQGSRTKKFEQIGNAVCPPLAAAVLGALIRASA